MTPRRRYEDFLGDILDAATRARCFIEGMSYDQFSADEKTVYAVVHALEVIGEAVTRIPQTIRDEHPEVPWQDMMGTRNRLIHGYWAVNRQVVWKTVTEDLPPLEPLIRQVLEDVQRLSQD